MLACQRLSCATQGAIRTCTSRHSSFVPVGRRLLVARASSGGDKSWKEIAEEAVGVAKDVGSKVADTIKRLVPSKKKTTDRSSLHRSPYGTEDDRPLPVPTMPGGILGGLMGGLVNTAIKGLAKELEKTAAETRSVADTAAERIAGSIRIKRCLGEVTVGLPVSQSSMSQNINGRVSKTVQLILPIYNLAGAPVAQAQVTQVEGQMNSSCRIAVRMPEGDTVLLEDDEPMSGGSSKAAAGMTGEVIDAEFTDIK